MDAVVVIVMKDGTEKEITVPNVGRGIATLDKIDQKVNKMTDLGDWKSWHLKTLK